jgi:phospholipid/cholesterol/gamma-HCH transport system substrate-binding protein
MNARIPSSAYKFGTFAAVSLTLTLVLAMLIGNVSLAPSRNFYATFEDAVGVFKGDRVRLSGVEVGAVSDIRLIERDGRRLARVKFSVRDGVPVYRSAVIRIRYENIVGQRYLSIEEEPSSAQTAPEGTTFGLDNTVPALSLTQLFNGFQPLFRALDPDDLNRFSDQIIRVLDGDEATLGSLMQSTASLTNALADRDQVIGSLIENLNAVLATVGDRDQQVTRLLVRFRRLMTGLAKDAPGIGADLQPLNTLLTSGARTLATVRSPLKDTLSALDPVVTQLVKDRATLDQALTQLPTTLETLARTGSYGSWFNFYVCGLELNLTLLGGTASLRGAAITANERDTVCAGGGS